MSDQLKQFGHVFDFELKYRLRQPALWVFSALFFFLTFTATSTDSVQIGGGIGNVARNAPYIISAWVERLALGVAGDDAHPPTKYCSKPAGCMIQD